ncbi:MAG TPA: hypothetical protein VLS85_07815 [Hanamia sp.]|nr:hypothetical protein [Hanamia sp.]
MLKGITIVFVFSIILFSCKKEQKSYQNAGVITGINFSQCPCVAACPCGCGGLFFHFTDTTYQENIPIDNPSIFKLPANVTFPFYVEVNWINTTRCGTFAITITDYKKR